MEQEMSRIEISADVDQADFTAPYTGAEMLAPLLALHEHLLAEAARLRKQLSPEAAKEPLPTLGGLIKQNPENEVKQKIKIALDSAFEAQLRAAEAKRKPDHVWTLRMRDLKWMYQQLAPT
jgi:hypothetical protein